MEQKQDNFFKDKAYRILFHEYSPVSLRNLSLLCDPKQELDALKLRDILVTDARFKSIDEIHWELATNWYDTVSDLSSNEFVVTDIETTGPFFYSDRIIEISALKVKNGCIIDEFYSYVDPEIPVPSSIIRLTGIKPKQLEGQPRIEEVMKDFIDFWGNGIFCAHDADFDLNFITSEIDRLGYDSFLGVPEICTLRLARKLITSISNHGLKGLSQYFNYEFKERHKAKEDTKATAYFLNRFIEMMGLVNKAQVHELINLQRKKLGKGQLNRLAKRKLRKLKAKKIAQ